MSILAISGKKQSGKNAIAKIINQLTNNKYEEKCFADKLKDIICILIGCTREQLENESFKSKELGEEWWYWYMERDGGYSPIILDYLTTTKKELKSYEGLELIKPTPRFLLQFIGTNLFRNQLHPEIWVNSLMSEYKPSPNLCEHYTQAWVNGIGNCLCNTSHKQSEGFKTMCEVESKYPNWIITDMRFPNELEAVKKKSGITIRVNRPCDICGGSGYHKMSCPVSKSGEHYSETALDKSEFDYVVDNDSDIESLIKKVREILIKEKLI